MIEFLIKLVSVGLLAYLVLMIITINYSGTSFVLGASDSATSLAEARRPY